MDLWEWGLCGQFLGPSMLSPSLTASPPAFGNTSAPPGSLLQITPACFTDIWVGALQWGLHFENHSGGSAARLSYFSWTAESQCFLDPWCCAGRWRPNPPTYKEASNTDLPVFLLPWTEQSQQDTEGHSSPETTQVHLGRAFSQGVCC